MKISVSCTRELDFQGLGALKNLSKGVGIPMQYWDAFLHHFFNDFGWFWGGFGRPEPVPGRPPEQEGEFAKT